MTNHRCCWYQAGRHQSCRRVGGSWRGWWGGVTRMADKTPAFLPLPFFFLKSFIKYICNSQLTCLLGFNFHSWQTQNPFPFRARLITSVLRQHSGVISSRGTVVPAFRPSGGSRPIRASHRGQPLSDWLTLTEGIQLCLRRKLSEKGMSGHVRWLLVVWSKQYLTQINRNRSRCMQKRKKCKSPKSPKLQTISSAWQCIMSVPIAINNSFLICDATNSSTSILYFNH